MRWPWRRPDPLIDDLIKPPKPKLGDTMDDSLRRRSEIRRAVADRLRREAARVETRDDGSARIHLVR